MSSQGRRVDHWRASLDVVELLRDRLADTDGREDSVTRALMAQVAHAKSSSFIALLDADGHVLDVNPAALISGGLDQAEVLGLPFWTTAWWREAGDRDGAGLLQRAVTAAGQGQFTRFDVEIHTAGPEPALGTLDLMLRPLRGRDGADRVHRGRGPLDHRPQAGRAAPGAQQRGAVGPDRAPDARARLSRAAARRALARPARAPARGRHARRAGPAHQSRRGPAASDRRHPACRARCARAGQQHARAGQVRPGRGPPDARQGRPGAGRAHRRRAVRAAGRRPRSRAARGRAGARCRRASTSSA